MFCTNCGNQLNDGARFCPSCGVPICESTSTPQMPPQQSTMQASTGYPLPPGIELVEDGTLFWTYSQSLWSNPTILYTVLKVMMISVVIVMMIIGGIALMDDSFEVLEILIIGGGLAVGISILSLLGYAVFAAISGGKYNMLFIMNEECVIHAVMPKEAAQGNRINDAATIVGVLTGSLTLAGMGMANYGRNSMTSNFADVKSIVQDRSHDLIKIRSGLDHNQIYASPAQYDFVLSYIATHCPGIRVE